MRRQSRQVVGIMVHIVAIRGLGRAAMATAVMGDNAIAVMQEEQQLRVPIIGRQRPAVAAHDRRARTPVLAPRRKRWPNISATSGSSSTTMMLTLMGSSLVENLRPVLG